MEPPLTLFAAVAAAHWEEARTCEKQTRMPSLRRQRAIEEGVEAAVARFWPAKRIEYQLRMLAFVLSEGNGLGDGNPADPSWGVSCCHADSGRECARYWGLNIPKRREEFIERLQRDDRFNIMIAAGELCFKESPMGGDWAAAVGATKYGGARFHAMRNNDPRPVTSYAAVAGYLKTLEHVQCLAQRISTRTYAACGCQP